MMAHDKIRAAARERMAQTGERYAAARRAAVTEHRVAGDEIPPPDAGRALWMSAEIRAASASGPRTWSPPSRGCEISIAACSTPAIRRKRGRQRTRWRPPGHDGAAAARRERRAMEHATVRDEMLGLLSLIFSEHTVG
jgi:hypothetical protein